MCGKGTFASTDGAACRECPAGWFQPQNLGPSPRCRLCPSGWGAIQDVNGRGVSGSAVCRDFNWVGPEDCSDTEFLNDTSLDPGEWSCLKCLPGSYCASNINASGIVAKFGWSRCPSRSDDDGTKKTMRLSSPPRFEKCPFGAACVGAPNPALRGVFNDDAEGSIDPALTGGGEAENMTEQCNVAYRSNKETANFLCSACAFGYSHAVGNSIGRCDACPAEQVNVSFTVLGILAGIVSIVFYVRITLSDAGDHEDADGVQSIALSYIQIISLVGTFPVAWPAVFTALFQIGGVITVLGQHAVNLKCMAPELTEADVFFQTRIAWALIPVGIVLTCHVVWLAINASCANYMKKHNVWTYVRTTSVALMYLVWPGLCTQVFSIFACSSFCGGTELRLRAALAETCYEGRHYYYVAALGVPMVLVYVLGFPIIALFKVRRLHKRAARENCSVRSFEAHHHTWGLLYSSFRVETWWWEATVAFRKIVVAMIGVFGASMGEMQTHLTLMLIFGVIVLTAVIKPYGGKSLKGAIVLDTLEVAALIALFCTLWAASVFSSYPKCQTVSEGGNMMENVGWCDTLAVAVGIVDVLVLVFIILVFLQMKGMAKCCCALVHTASRASKRLTHHEQGAESRGVSNPRGATEQKLKARMRDRLRQMKAVNGMHRSGERIGGRGGARGGEREHAASPTVIVPSDTHNEIGIPLPAHEQPKTGIRLPPLPNVGERVNQKIEILHSHAQHVERSLTVDREGRHRKLEERRLRVHRKRSKGKS